MNTLHMHNEHIVSKLNEIIDLIKQPLGNPKSDLFHAIIAFIICATIVIVARYAIKRFFDWKVKEQESGIAQKNKERLDQENDKKLELKKEYQAKVLDYLKEVTDSEKSKEDTNPYLSKLAEYIGDLDNVISTEKNKPC